MKLTTKEIIRIREGIDKLGAEKLPAATSFRLKNIFKEVNPIAQNAEDEKNKIIEEKGVCRKGVYSIEHPDKVKEFNTEYEKLLEVEIELNISKINISAFENTGISVEVCYLLDSILEGEG